MSQSLKARFNGNAAEVVEYARTFGRGKAMEKYEVRDYVAFHNFLKEQTGDDHFGLTPTIGDLSNTGESSTFAALVEAFTGKVLRMEAEKARLVERLQAVERRLAYFEAHEALQAEAKVGQLMELCKT